MGLRPQVASMLSRIADWGYVVLAPNVFHRAGRIADLAPREDLRVPGARERHLDLIGPGLQLLTPDHVVDDLGRYLRAVTTLPDVVSAPVGVTGYCMGARFALIAACTYPETVAAVGGWHGGMLATDQPDSPHLQLPVARATFAFGHATNDPSMPDTDIARLGTALARARLPHTNEVFPGPHGYTMSDTAVYSPNADALHWQQLEHLLRNNLG
jgi:carboxymethylenebutenolidase